MIGILAAEAAFDALLKDSNSMDAYWTLLKKSWIWDELHRARNYRPVTKLNQALTYFGW